MEKVVVRIGRISERSQHASKFDRNTGDDIKFLVDCFEMSSLRARNLIDEMRNSGNGGAVSECIDVVLNYRQLARYTAKRCCEGLVYYWKYPYVVEHIEDEEPEAENPPVELRPKKRKRG